jgi:signal transduction histidine kinase/CheY-like chemotaxis protein
MHTAFTKRFISRLIELNFYCALPLLLLSLLRYRQIGIHWILLMHLLCACSLAAAYLFKKKVTPRLGGHILSLVYFALAIGATIFNGGPVYGQVFFVLSFLIGGMLLSLKETTTYFVLAITFQVTFWYFYSTNTPVVQTVGAIVFSAIVVYIIYQIKTYLVANVISAQNAEQKIKSSFDQKNIFFSSMTHELRTPLVGMIAGTEVLKGADLPSDQKEVVYSIDRLNKHLLTLVNDILDISKIEQKKLELHFDTHSLKGLIDDVISTHQIAAKNKGIELLVDTEFDEKLYIKTDKTRLSQVLHNLLGNSIKFTETGFVKLKVQSIENKSSEQGTFAFEVIDTGVGIAKDNLESIFIPYRQESAEKSVRFGGTGLGLSISKQILRLFGSNLKVESDLGRGSKFHFLIDFAYGEKNGQDNNNETEIVDLLTAKHINILIAEDNDINRKLMRAMFKKLGLKVDVAKDGLEVLEALNYKKFDIIFMDVMMPNLDGLQTTKKIREHENESFRDLYIVGCSANNSGDYDEGCIAGGMDASIAKPILRENLFMSLNKFIIKKGIR